MFYNDLKYNLVKLYLFSAFSSFMLFTPVIVLFLQDNGLSMTEIMVLQAIYSLSVVFLEIPTGYLADYYGRRHMLILSSFFLFTGISIYSVGTGFFGFLAAELVWSVGIALYHGSDSALFYDTLVELGRESDYQRLWGNASSIGFVSVAVASVLGGFLADIDLRLTLQGMIPVLALLVPLTFSLKEAEKHKEVTDQHLSEIKKSIKIAFLEKMDLRFLIVYSALIILMTKAGFIVYQPYFENSGLQIAYFGIIFALFNIMSAITSKKAHSIESVLGRKKTLATLTILTAAGFLLMGSIIFYFSFLFAFLHQIVRGLREPIISDYINQIIPSHRRSTILSIEHMASNTIYALAAPLIGLYTDIYSYTAAMTMLGITTLIIGTITLTLFYTTRI